jgi:APA family basic amino acid/polyamine antiporter
MSDRLKQKLTTYGLTMIAIGSSIGSGIFVTPAETFKYIPSMFWVFVPWIFGGVASLMGALTFAELGARYPKAGGVYVYLKEAYGPLFGFLYGWIILFIVNTGALAALGMAFADFLNFFFLVEGSSKQLIALFTICGLSALNIFGIGISQSFSNIFSGLKVLALILIIFTGLYFYLSGQSHNHGYADTSVPPDLTRGILMAFVGVFWSFGGWHHITYLSGEAIEPQKTVPRALFNSTLVITAIYLLVIFSYSTLLSYDDIITSNRIAGDAVANVINNGGKLVTLAIAISIFGTIGIYTMTAPRIYFAMAKDGLFFNALSKLHKDYKSPHVAIIAQAVWACLLVLIYDSFERIITFVTFMDIVFMALATASIFIIRRKYKGVIPAYNTIAYPFVPLIYLIISISFVVFTLLQMNREALAGLVILLLGIPMYYYFSRKQKN